MARTVKDAALETRTARARLKVSGKPHYKALDQGLHLGYRKGKNGGKWVVRCYAGAEKYRVETIEGIADDKLDADGTAVLSFAQAQKKARDLYVALNGDPQAEAGPLTVRQACDAYIEFLGPERKSARNARSRLEKHVFPKIGDRPVGALAMAEIEHVKHGMVRHVAGDPDAERRSMDSANRVLTMIKAALNRAFLDPGNKIASDAAWHRVKPFKNVGRARDIFLDEAQARRLVNVCRGAFRNLVTAALLTGARPPGELKRVRVRDFNRRLGTLAIPGGKTGPREIVLTSEAVRFFEEIAAGKAPDALLLPKDDGEAWEDNDHTPLMREAVARAKLPQDCTVYTLRHTHASHALMNGMNLQLLAENMGTSVKQIEETYGRFTKEKRRQLIEEHGFKLGLKPGNVKALGAAE